MSERKSYLTSIGFFVAGGIAGALAGGVAGATAALLWAPQSGSAARDATARKLDAVAGAARESARQMKERTLRKGEAMLEEASQRVIDAAAALARGDGHRGRKPNKSASV
jgi:gas vesicle protein